MSAIITPLSKVSSFFSKRIHLDTLDNQRVRYYHPPLSKVSSFFSKRIHLDTLDNSARAQARAHERGDHHTEGVVG